MIVISPKTKVGELLDAHPEMESVLIEMSPAFEKLKNPILRKTVARVATLGQIAIVGNLKVETIINKLREKLGQVSQESGSPETDYLSSSPPEWFDRGKISIRYDASPVINSGGSPMKEILQKASLLNAGEIMQLTTPFIPAPIIDMLMEKGFLVFCIQNGEITDTFLYR
jgi:hypothetical protein